MSFEVIDDRGYYAPPARNLDAYSLGDLGVVPLIYLVYAAGVGAVAAGTAVAAWLAKDDWSVGEYNTHMAEMYQTILTWDKIGWAKGCWNDTSRRARWVTFMNAFGAHYKAHGQISGASYVSDSEEKPARDLMAQLAVWGDALNAACSLDVPSVLPETKPETPAIDYLKWGVYLVGGVVALQLIGAVRSATATYR